MVGLDVVYFPDIRIQIGFQLSFSLSKIKFAEYLDKNHMPDICVENYPFGVEIKLFNI